MLKQGYGFSILIQPVYCPNLKDTELSRKVTLVETSYVMQLTIRTKQNLTEQKDGN